MNLIVSIKNFGGKHNESITHLNYLTYKGWLPLKSCKKEAIDKVIGLSKYLIDSYLLTLDNWTHPQIYQMDGTLCSTLSFNNFLVLSMYSRRSSLAIDELWDVATYWETSSMICTYRLPGLMCSNVWLFGFVEIIGSPDYKHGPVLSLLKMILGLD